MCDTYVELSLTIGYKDTEVIIADQIHDSPQTEHNEYISLSYVQESIGFRLWFHRSIGKLYHHYVKYNNKIVYIHQTIRIMGDELYDNKTKLLDDQNGIVWRRPS